jgi:DNA repair exonuclease SbcCD nuclease subunit
MSREYYVATSRRLLVSDFKFLHAADVHLDAPLVGLARYPGAPLEDVRGSTRRAFTNLVDLAIRERVAFIAIAGDLFDGAGRDYHTALFFISEASRLRSAEIPLLVISGNHDAQSVLVKQLHAPDNVTLLPATKPESVVLENVPAVVHGQGFARPQLLDNLVDNYPAPHSGVLNVGLLHTSVDGRLGHAGYAPCKLADLQGKGYDYFALGHVHAREVLSSEPWIVFSGCTQGRHIREAGAKGATLVTVESDEITSVDHHDLDVLRWAQIDVSATAADEDELLTRVRDAVETAAADCDSRLLAVRLVITGQTTLHRTLVAERERMINEFRVAVGDAAFGQAWLERVKFETAVPVDVARLMARDDAVGGLLRTLRALPNDQTALQELGTELTDLKRKFHEVTDEDFDLDDPALIARLVGDVEHLLIPRLSGVDA